MNETALTSDPGRILLVDDDAAVRVVMRRALAQAGLMVVEASSGDRAAELLAGPDVFDMLVTDVRMPGQRDGVALASDWRERVPGRPVLFVSGFTDNRLDEACLGPHEAVIRKPFQRASLVEAVRRLLASNEGTA